MKSLIPLLIYAVEFTYAQVAFTLSYLGDMIVIMFYEKLLANLVYQKIILDIRNRVEHTLIYMNSKYLYKKHKEFGEKDIESILLGDIDALRIY